MGSWHTSVSPCHCDNPLNCGLMFFKRKIFNHVLIKRVVTSLVHESTKLVFTNKSSTICDTN
jgi:hypothetical protein